ncbi:MAG TPA: thioredoxin-disulfide reductase [bacterium]|nr:thioredoxin-disulfide reductase [bacterium]
MSVKKHDLVIIGGGVAGYSAGIYAGRDNLDTVLLEKEISGGTTGITDLVDNYPGFPEGIKGPELMERMKKQGEKFGVKIDEFVEVQEIHPNDSKIMLSTNQGDYESSAVIISTGGHPRKLGLESEKRLSGRGVSYCATCDGPFYKGEEIAVIGGGDSAVQEALYLTEFADKVSIVHRRDELRAVSSLAEKAFANDKIEIIWDSVVDEILGDEEVDGLRLKNVKTDETSQIDVKGVFIFIGWIPNTGFVKDLLKLDDQNRIVVNEHMETSVPRIYAAGDVISKKHRQIATAVGEATNAALNASEKIHD